MNSTFTDKDVHHGVLNINTHGQPFEADIIAPVTAVTVNIAKTETGNGVINLGSDVSSELINYQGSGDLKIKWGSGSESFVQQNTAQSHIDATADQSGGSTSYTLNGAHLNVDYTFEQAVSGTTLLGYFNGHGQDTINGFSPGYDTLTINTGGQVTADNFSQWFTVHDSGNGDVITALGPASITLVGVHDTASQLIAEGAFIFMQGERSRGQTITSPSGGHSPVLDGGAGNNTLVATNGAGTDTYV